MAEAVMVLSENWTLTPPDDLRALVDLAVVAEKAGVGAVMLSEHVVMGPSAGAAGRMANPREYAAPGNQDPATPWPDSIVLASSIAAVTSTIRIALAAVIVPLRHPLLLAKQLATLDRLCAGRLVVQPTVSWSAEEYAALGVPFERRGAILDESLDAMEAAWTASPASFEGRFVSFHDVHVEPKPHRPGGPLMWFGGRNVHEALLRRLVRYGHGFHPFGSPSDRDLDHVRNALSKAGRDPAGLEIIGGIRGTFRDATGVADLDEAMVSIPSQVARGFTGICFKPSMFTDDVGMVSALCHRVVDRIDAASAALRRG